MGRYRADKHHQSRFSARSVIAEGFRHAVGEGNHDEIGVVERDDAEHKSGKKHAVKRAIIGTAASKNAPDGHPLQKPAFNHHIDQRIRADDHIHQRTGPRLERHFNGRKSAQHIYRRQKNGRNNDIEEFKNDSAYIKYGYG